MRGISRFTVSLPAELLADLDHKLSRQGESRSAVIRRLLEEALRVAEEQEDIARYVQGYSDQPQTEEEFGWTDPVARHHLAEVPWT